MNIVDFYALYRQVMKKRTEALAAKVGTRLVFAKLPLAKVFGGKWDLTLTGTKRK